MRTQFAFERGFAFIEMIVLLVIVAMLAVVAVAKMTSPGMGTLWANSIRHMQVLAQTWGRPLQLTAVPGVNGSYSVSCVTAGVAPCDVSPVNDPVTGQAFTVTLQQGVSLAVSGTDSNPKRVDFQGRPLTSGGTVSTAAATYTLTVDTAAATVTA